MDCWVTSESGHSSHIGENCVLQMVELASKKFVCIIDESKLVDGLGGSKGRCHAAAQLFSATCVCSDV